MDSNLSSGRFRPHRTTEIAKKHWDGMDWILIGYFSCPVGDGRDSTVDRMQAIVRIVIRGMVDLVSH